MGRLQKTVIEFIRRPLAARGIFCPVLPYQQPHGVQQVFQIVAVQRVFNAGGVVRDRGAVPQRGFLGIHTFS